MPLATRTRTEGFRKSGLSHSWNSLPTGNFDKGNYNTNDQVDIVSRNISIKGNGLIVRNNGDYMKVKGKAFLEMLY